MEGPYRRQDVRLSSDERERLWQVLDRALLLCMVDPDGSWEYAWYVVREAQACGHDDIRVAAEELLAVLFCN